MCFVFAFLNQLQNCMAFIVEIQSTIFNKNKIKYGYFDGLCLSQKALYCIVNILCSFLLFWTQVVTSILYNHSSPKVRIENLVYCGYSNKKKECQSFEQLGVISSTLAFPTLGLSTNTSPTTSKKVSCTEKSSCKT